jgi:hypothetical protein
MAQPSFIRCVKEVTMDWNQQWGKLTDDDLTLIDGKSDTESPGMRPANKSTLGINAKCWQ